MALAARGSGSALQLWVCLWRWLGCAEVMVGKPYLSNINRCKASEAPATALLVPHPLTLGMACQLRPPPSPSRLASRPSQHLGALVGIVPAWCQPHARHGACCCARSFPMRTRDPHLLQVSPAETCLKPPSQLPAPRVQVHNQSCTLVTTDCQAGGSSGPDSLTGGTLYVLQWTGMPMRCGRCQVGGRAGCRMGSRQCKNLWWHRRAAGGSLVGWLGGLGGLQGGHAPGASLGRARQA